MGSSARPLVELVNVALRPFRTPGTSLYLTGRAKSASEHAQARDIAYVSLRASDAKLAEQARRVQELGTWDRLTHDDLNVDRLVSPEAFDEANGLANLGIADLLGRHVLELSTGQLRKICIAQELLKRPRICIFDEPFDGLDVESRSSLASLLAQPGPTQTVLISHRINEISEVPGITHVLEIGEDNQIRRMGRKEDILENQDVMSHLDHAAQTKWADAGAVEPQLRDEIASLLKESAPPARSNQDVEVPIIEMKNVKVQFGDAVILKDLSWTIRPGEHWSVEGPNGSGGQQRLVLICRALASGPHDLLLLDEPFHGLDAATRQHMLSVLEIVKDHCAMVFVTHHADERPLFIKNRLVLKPGERPEIIHNSS
ncbi:ABC-type molybdenum transporter ATP-binding protein ModF [Hondaea fermentalgiana]|uniref:ABC-type molybdenum transporter ATP-binding protein ModF n=1 Tax=Hondaea fermentalgiana TaxID=2315210 RepID=A0A2R5GAL4_9STRA|nr:ABC-type molybdenum transporter ATP-binding protein ModF [Hondaea fermentalgiana]|eukprot:GBG27339.1 ABC-type molybdenum transporter ATP-binding protein ModF [Hondaea fermentalgiana]